MPGFDSPPRESLPDKLKPIVIHQGIPYSNAFFDAMMDKITDYLRASHAAGRVDQLESHSRAAINQTNRNSRYSSGRIPKVVAMFRPKLRRRGTCPYCRTPLPRGKGTAHIAGGIFDSRMSH